MEMDITGSIASARLRAIYDYLVLSALRQPLIYLSGSAGSGKTFLAVKVLQSSQERTLIISWSQKYRYGAQWHVMADNAGDNGCKGRFYSRGQLWPALMNDLQLGPRRFLTIIIENAHWYGHDITQDIVLFRQYFPGARLILTGEHDHRLLRALRRLNAEFIALESLTEQDARTLLIEESRLSYAENVFVSSFVRRLLHLSGGHIGRLKTAATATALLLEAEQTQELSREQQQVIYRLLGDKRDRRRYLRVLLSGAILAIAAGWMASARLSDLFPLVPQFLPPSPTTQNSAAPDITQTKTSEREAFSHLFSTWGFDVPPEDAWCDQAQRARLLCKSGSAALKALVAQGLPWIASLHVGEVSIPVVVVRHNEDSLDVLIGQQTWTLQREWFESVWKGDYLLLWKPSPAGRKNIARDSSEQDIVWLEQTLNRAMNLTSIPTGEWSPLLVEKIRLFQKRVQLNADGVVGPSTLMHLWHSTNESARLFNDEDKKH